jgi:hypothetical protein
VASYAYDLPFGKASRWLKGWQTFGILQFQTGQPFTVDLLADDDNSNTGIDSLGFGANDRPNVFGNPKLSNPSANEWFNTRLSRFRPTARSATPAAIRWKGRAWPPWISRSSRTRPFASAPRCNSASRHSTLLNHTNFGLPDNFIGSPTFGQILSAGNPRRLQLGLKLLF